MILGLGVAAFLALYWTLRGAAPGMSIVEDEPGAMPARRRDLLIAGLAGGLVALVLGALMAFTAGILPAIPVMAAGTGLAFRLIVVARRYRHASPVLGRAAEISATLLNAGLLAGVLAVMNVAAFRYGSRAIDMTRERTFSLSSLSLNQLRRLDRPLTFHLVYGGGAQAVRQLERIYQLLDLYRAAGDGRVRIENLNPYTEIARAEDMARRAPDLAVLRGGGVLIEYGEGKDAEYSVVANQDLFALASPESARPDSDRFETTFRGEDAITSALIRLGEGKKSKVAFTIGHGEPSSVDVNPNGPGIGLWRGRLASVGCEVVELNLQRDPVPDDLALMIVAGPKDPFRPEEVAKLKAYADRGGPILALVGNLEPVGLDELLKSFNLELGRGMVIDPTHNFNSNLQFVFASPRGTQGQPIADAIPPNRAILLPYAAPIHVLGLGGQGKAASAPENPNLIPTVILRTGPQSWAETDLSNPRPQIDKVADEVGPIIVGVAVQDRAATATPGAERSTAAPRPRLVLFSSGTMGANFVKAIAPANMDLLMSAASWLRGRPDAIGITPSTHTALTLRADPALRSRLILVPTVMSILGVLAVGTIVYVSRRE
ncbi:Gldg family protein [Aquisphaera insulae]|uniref:Gldg family protein n=1 Tax=Aquisphaera insulae TaxID=2712864 RepID=UPI0013ED1B3F|nr:Gldg family protein [Aquisphaera insulae]